MSVSYMLLTFATGESITYISHRIRCKDFGMCSGGITWSYFSGRWNAGCGKGT